MVHEGSHICEGREQQRNQDATEGRVRPGGAIAPCAALLYRATLDEVPTFRYGWVSYGQALYELGDYAAAIEQFKEALALVTLSIFLPFWQGYAFNPRRFPRRVP
jgi:tetratricopeptide (TPR) repeat protein